MSSLTFLYVHEKVLLCHTSLQYSSTFSRVCLFGVAVKDVCQTYKEKDLLDCQQYQNLAETTLTEILAKQGKDKSLIKS